MDITNRHLKKIVFVIFLAVSSYYIISQTIAKTPDLDKQTTDIEEIVNNDLGISLFVPKGTIYGKVVYIYTDDNTKKNFDLGITRTENILTLEDAKEFSKGISDLEETIVIDNYNLLVSEMPEKETNIQTQHYFFRTKKGKYLLITIIANASEKSAARKIITSIK